jgi:hypothetical protein
MQAPRRQGCLSSCRGSVYGLPWSARVHGAGDEHRGCEGRRYEPPRPRPRGRPFFPADRSHRRVRHEVDGVRGKQLRLDGTRRVQPLLIRRMGSAQGPEPGSARRALSLDRDGRLTDARFETRVAHEADAGWVRGPGPISPTVFGDLPPQRHLTDRRPGDPTQPRQLVPVGGRVHAARASSAGRTMPAARTRCNERLSRRPVFGASERRQEERPVAFHDGPSPPTIDLLGGKRRGPPEGTHHPILYPSGGTSDPTARADRDRSGRADDRCSAGCWRTDRPRCGRASRP